MFICSTLADHIFYVAFAPFLWLNIACIEKDAFF